MVVTPNFSLISIVTKGPHGHLNFVEFMALMQIIIKPALVRYSDKSQHRRMRNIIDVEDREFSSRFDHDVVYI